MVLLSSPQPSRRKYPLRVLVSFCLRITAATISSKHQAPKQPKDLDPRNVRSRVESETRANPTVIRHSSIASTGDPLSSRFVSPLRCLRKHIRHGSRSYIETILKKSGF